MNQMLASCPGGGMPDIGHRWPDVWRWWHLGSDAERQSGDGGIWDLMPGRVAMVASGT